jgi:hypothetical protein
MGDPEKIIILLFLKFTYIMSTLNRKLLLNTLIKHETLTLEDVGEEKNLCLIPNKHHLQLLLDELEEESYIQKLEGAVPCTYTITDKGIAERNRLKQV